MLTFAVALGFEKVYEDHYNLKLPIKTHKFFMTMIFGEIILCITMVIIAHLIATNKLPSALQFLQGRTQLATGLMITGITSIALPLIGMFVMGYWKLFADLKTPPL